MAAFRIPVIILVALFYHSTNPFFFVLFTFLKLKRPLMLSRHQNDHIFVRFILLIVKDI